MGGLRFVFGAAGVAAALLFPARELAAAQLEAATQAIQEAQPAAARGFTPPDSGHLTPDQVRMYISVRRQVMAAAARVNADASQPQIARVLAVINGDAKATSDAGVDLDEYRWVSARIAETEPAPSSPAGAQLVDIIAAAINRNGDQAAGDVDPAARAAAEQATAARVSYNRGLLERYRTELDALGKPGHR